MYQGQNIEMVVIVKLGRRHLHSVWRQCHHQSLFDL